MLLDSFKIFNFLYTLIIPQNHLHHLKNLNQLNLISSNFLIFLQYLLKKSLEKMFGYNLFLSLFTYFFSQYLLLISDNSTILNSFLSYLFHIVSTFINILVCSFLNLLSFFYLNLTFFVKPHIMSCI